MHFFSKKKGASVLLLLVSLCMILASFFSFTIFQRSMRQSLTQKTQEALKQDTTKSVALFQNLLGGYFYQLDTVAFFCGAGSDLLSETILGPIRQSNRESTGCKLGVAGPDGLLSVGTGTPVDIASTPYFKKALSGERAISGVVTDLMEKGSSIVLAEPVRSDRQIIGVACAIYDVSSLSSLLGSSQFDQGATLVIQGDGKVVSGYQGLERFSTFYDALAEMEFKGRDTLENLQASIAAGESGLFTYYRGDRARYLYYEPVGVNDWYLISLVTAESMDRELEELTTQSFTLMGFNLFFCGVLLFVVIRLVRLSRESGMDQKDTLTMLQNKRACRLQMERYLKREGKKKSHACFFIDVDNFKQINDTLGHNAGDLLLIKFARHMKNTFREGDILSRFGGDEFIVWMKDVPSREIVESKAETLRRLVMDDPNFSTSVSIGVACYPEDADHYDDCLQCADEALYEAKKLGKNRYCFYQNSAASGAKNTK